MKKLFLLAAVLAQLTACAQLPAIHRDKAAPPAEAVSECIRIFPQGRWQLYHIIEATTPGNRRSTLSGVAVVSAEERSIQWALMTVEGFVLFSGRYDGTLTIQRAIAPFNRPGFAQGLMADLMMLYFPPQAPLLAVGRLETGERVCRFREPDDSTTDIITRDDESWSIHRYDSDRKLRRSVEADRMTRMGDRRFPEHMVLENPGVLGYRLELTLVEAIQLDR